ncbi:PRD domain-containing protein [Paenibacillus polymyxa]|uniref:PRD domain-containing protein n=1 Tax=Paenibacillus polymyxa TaxID=1406 RepID=UPI0032AFBA46
MQEKRKNEKYIIKRIINNNVITSIDEETQKEIVLMGKGISFTKSLGDEVDISTVEKTFILANNDKRRYIDLIENVDNTYFEISMEIIQHAEQVISSKLNPIGIIMLADHIESAIDRYKDISLKNDMLIELKRFYPIEYKVGLFGLDLIANKIGVRLPEDEVGFIALHIINAIGKDYYTNGRESVQFITKVIQIVETYFEVTLDKESIYYDRFMTHLKYFSNRVLNKKQEDSNKDFVYRMLKIEYSDASKCVDIIEAKIETVYHIKIGDEEKGYLIVHIKNLIQNNKIVTERARLE